MIATTTHSLSTVLGQLDKCSKKRVLKLKGVNTPIRIGTSRNPGFNRLYEMYKDGTPLKCNCCGAEPQFVTYSTANGLKMVVGGKKNFLNIDHIIPLSKGGSWDKANLAIMCFNCNIAKGNTINEQTEALIAMHGKQYDLVGIYKLLKDRFKKYKEEIKRAIFRLIDILGTRVVDEQTFMKKVVKHLEALIVDFKPEKIRFRVVPC
jgi:hypothetical protein